MKHLYIWQFTKEALASDATITMYFCGDAWYADYDSDIANFSVSGETPDNALRELSRMAKKEQNCENFSL